MNSTLTRGRRAATVSWFTAVAAPLALAATLVVATFLAAGCGDDDEGDDLTTDETAVKNAGITLWRSVDAALLANTGALDFGAGLTRAVNKEIAVLPAHEYGLECPDITVTPMLTEIRAFVGYGDDGCTSELTGEFHSGFDSTVTIDARDVTVVSPDGSVSLTSCMGITWSKGGTRLQLTDDSWRIEGTGVVNTLDFKSGAIYDVEVVTGHPLVVLGSCSWPVSGTLTIERREPPLSASLDFGSGACDALATLTVAGRRQTIDLEAR
ncbi:MAG: hypothetical protein FD129_3399 [bacterium]|nr:MAG: hypothetical protein FD129_3399 [bacterium]